MKISEVSFRNNKGERLSGRIYSPDIPTESGLIFCHGLFSSKDGYKITNLTGDIVNTGLNLFVFDFSFSGNSEGSIADISIMQEVDDLRAAYDFFKSKGIKKIHLMGSSMGAAVSILFSAEKPKDLASLITIAAPVALNELFSDYTDNREYDSLSDDDLIDIDGVPVKYSFFKELREINVSAVLGSIEVPVLVFHGSDDSIVNVNNAFLLKEGLLSDCETNLIDGGDHNLTSDLFMGILRKKIIKWLSEKK